MSEWKQANIPDMGPIITQYCRDINTKLEDNLMLTVEKAVGFHVDKDRLLQALTDARAFYEEGYRAAMRRSEWISVKERLPEHEGSVLCVTKNGNPFVGRYDHTWNHWRVSGSVCVTHWMPLPEPPKEG